MNAATPNFESNAASAAAIISPHPEIKLSTDGDRLLVRAPSMPQTDSILKAAGIGQMQRNSKAEPFSVAVTDGNRRDVQERLNAVRDTWDRAFIPPHNGKPGVVIDHKLGDILAKASPNDFAADPQIRQAVTGFNDAVNLALSSGEKTALLKADPQGINDFERLAACHDESGRWLETTSAAIKAAMTLEREGQRLITQQQDLAQQDQSLSR